MRFNTANANIQAGIAYFGAPEHAVVTDNADPLGLHRVRVRIPGMAEDSPWAFPVGTQGGGSPQRGAWTSPKVGADVVVMFLGGDFDRPVYWCAWWGIPEAGTEVPTEVAAVPNAEAHLIQTIHESDRVKVWVDERAGKEQIAIADKGDPDTYLQIDMTQGSITISATASVIIKCLGLVRIEGAQVTIQDRVVNPDVKAI